MLKGETSRKMRPNCTHLFKKFSHLFYKIYFFCKQIKRPMAEHFENNLLYKRFIFTQINSFVSNVWKKRFKLKEFVSKLFSFSMVLHVVVIYWSEKIQLIRIWLRVHAIIKYVFLNPSIYSIKGESFMKASTFWHNILSTGCLYYYIITNCWKTSWKNMLKADLYLPTCVCSNEIGTWIRWAEYWFTIRIRNNERGFYLIKMNSSSHRRRVIIFCIILSSFVFRLFVSFLYLLNQWISSAKGGGEIVVFYYDEKSLVLCWFVLVCLCVCLFVRVRVCVCL